MLVKRFIRRILGLKIIASGGGIDYVGATDIELIGPSNLQDHLKVIKDQKSRLFVIVNTKLLGPELNSGLG